MASGKTARTNSFEVTVVKPTEVGAKEIIAFTFTYEIATPDSDDFDDSWPVTLVEDALRLAAKLDARKPPRSEALLLAVIAANYLRTHAGLDYDV